MAVELRRATFGAGDPATRDGHASSAFGCRDRPLDASIPIAAVRDHAVGLRLQLLEQPPVVTAREVLQHVGLARVRLHDGDAAVEAGNEIGIDERLLGRPECVQLVGEVSAVQRAGRSGVRIKLQNLRGHTGSVFGSSHQVCLSSGTAAISGNTAFTRSMMPAAGTRQCLLAIDKLDIDHALDRRQLRRTSVQLIAVSLAEPPHTITFFERVRETTSHIADNGSGANSRYLRVRGSPPSSHDK
jgi:hypothetical protein